MPVQPAPEKHEPVALPPPPIVAPAPPPATTATHAPRTQPAPTPPQVVIVKPTTQPGPIDEKVAYAIGYAAGRRTRERLEEDGRTVDDVMVMRGILDGLDGRDPTFSPQEVRAALAEALAYTQQRRAEKQYADNPSFRKTADENLQKSRALLDQNAEMAQVEVQPDGVQVQEITPGTGRIVGNAKSFTVKGLRVSLADGTLIQSTEGDQTEKISATDALPALLDVLRGMRVGTRCRVWLPPDKAYGLAGKPPEVGPNEAIEYEFELVGAE